MTNIVNNFEIFCRRLIIEYMANGREIHKHKKIESHPDSNHELFVELNPTSNPYEYDENEYHQFKQSLIT